MGKNLTIILVSLVLVVVIGFGGVVLLVKYAGQFVIDPAENARRNAQQGGEALQAKDYDKAIDCFTVAIKFNPTDPVLLHNRGLAYYGKGKYEKAIADYNAAILHNSNEPEYFTTAARRNWRCPDTTTPSTDFNQALEHKADYVPAYRGRERSMSSKSHRTTTKRWWSTRRPSTSMPTMPPPMTNAPRCIAI